MSWVEIVSFIIVTAISFVVLILVLFYAKLETGNIMYIYHGDTLWKTISDVRGKKVDGHKLVDLMSGEDEKNWLAKHFGLYYVGTPGIASVKRFKIQKKKEREITTGRPPGEWIEDLGSVEVNSLRAAFPRPFLLLGVELGDRQMVDLLVVCKAVVRDTYPPVPELKGDFFGNFGSTVKAAVDDILKGIPSMDAFVLSTKGEGGILSPLEDHTGPFNEALEKQVGLHVVGATIPAWTPSDPAIRAAMNRKFIAEREKEAVIVAASAYFERVGKETEADANRIRALAEAREVEVSATVRGLVLPSSDPTVVSRAAADILEMQAATGEHSQITTLVQRGSNSNTAVVVPGKEGK